MLKGETKKDSFKVLFCIAISILLGDQLVASLANVLAAVDRALNVLRIFSESGKDCQCFEQSFQSLTLSCPMTGLVLSESFRNYLQP